MDLRQLRADTWSRDRGPLPKLRPSSNDFQNRWTFLEAKKAELMSQMFRGVKIRDPNVFLFYQKNGGISQGQGTICDAAAAIALMMQLLETDLEATDERDPLIAWDANS